MALEPIPAALVGVNEVGLAYAQAVRQDERFELCAVGDTDDKALREAGETFGVPVFNDYRSLIIETLHDGLAWLLVAVPPFQSVELLRLAAEKGIGVFCRPPFARSAEAAAKLAGHFKQHGCPLIISRPWRFDPAFDLLLSLQDHIGWVYAAAAQFCTTLDGREGWRGDSERAGGGVLLNDAYEVADLLVSVLGVPQQVSAYRGFATSPGVARAYDTEDSMIMAMQCGPERIGSFTAHRCMIRGGWRIRFLGADGEAEVTAAGTIVTRRSVEETVATTSEGDNRYQAEIAALADWHDRQSRKHASAVETHLPTMAVIEATYLSARTGSAESPDRFLS
jgi:predicted dehydrogenase